jgi:hypothetical protein
MPQEVGRSPCGFAQQEHPDRPLTHGLPYKLHGSDCSFALPALRPSGFLESSSSKIGGSGWLRSTSGRLVHASCPAAVSKRRTEGCSMVKSWPLFFRKLTSSNACAFWILEVHSAPEHLSQLPPPSFDGSYLLCSSEQGCDLDHSSMCDTPRIVGLVFCRDTSAVEAA